MDAQTNKTSIAGSNAAIRRVSEVVCAGAAATSRRATHNAAVARLAAQLTARGITATVCAGLRADHLLINNRIVRVHVASPKRFICHYKSTTYAYPAYGWSRHVRGVPQSASGVEILCTTDDPSLVIVLPPQAIKGRRTFKLLVGTTPDKRRSMLWRYLERWELL